MEKTIKNWFTGMQTSFLGQNPVRVVLILLLLLAVLACILGPLCDIIPIEDLWE